MVAFGSVHRDSVNNCLLDGRVKVAIACSSSVVVWMGGHSDSSQYID